MLLKLTVHIVLKLVLRVKRKLSLNTVIYGPKQSD